MRLTPQRSSPHQLPWQPESPTYCTPRNAVWTMVEAILSCTFSFFFSVHAYFPFLVFTEMHALCAHVGVSDIFLCRWLDILLRSQSVNGILIGLHDFLYFCVFFDFSQKRVLRWHPFMMHTIFTLEMIKQNDTGGKIRKTFVSFDPVIVVANVYFCIFTAHMCK